MSEPKKEIKWGFIIIAFAVGMMAGSLVGGFSRVSGLNALRAEAVKAGAGRYVVSDEYGGTRFEWTTVPLPEKPEKK